MWTEIFRALTRPSKTCPRCGSARVRISRQPYGQMARLMGIRAYRCEACQERYPTGRWRLRHPPTYAPPPEFWPPALNEPPRRPAPDANAAPAGPSGPDPATPPEPGSDGKVR